MDAANTTHRPPQEPSRQPNVGVPTYVEPKYVPGLGDLSTVPESGPSHSENYRNNHKDSPGNFRGREEKSSREFGTQTGLVFRSENFDYFAFYYFPILFIFNHC